MGLKIRHLYKRLNAVNTINPNKIGSVGNAISKSKLKLFNSERGIDNGVKKNKGSKILLKLETEDNTIPRQNGKINNK